jgi:hypothetical protein
MGAAQVAAVAAQPLPAYEKGTGDSGHPETGPALVHPNEAIITPSGKVFKTPKKPVILNLKKGTVVKPDFNKFVAEQTRDIVNLSKEVNPVYSLENRELIEGNREILRQLEKIAQKEPGNVSVNLDKNGIWAIVENGRKKTEYINQVVNRKI